MPTNATIQWQGHLSPGLFLSTKGSTTSSSDQQLLQPTIMTATFQCATLADRRDGGLKTERMASKTTSAQRDDSRPALDRFPASPAIDPLAAYWPW